MDVVKDVLELYQVAGTAAEEWALEAMAGLVGEGMDAARLSVEWQEAFAEVAADAGVEGASVGQALAFVAARIGAVVARTSGGAASDGNGGSDGSDGSDGDDNVYAVVCRDDDGRVLSLAEVEWELEAANAACLFTEDLVDATRADDPRERTQALRDLCPCHVKKDVDAFWRRILEMVTDESPDVRYQVLHNLCDGSPLHLEADVIAAIEELHRDSSKKVARAARRVLVQYRKSGRWNVM